MNKEIGQWLTILGLIAVSAYCLYQKENTLAGVAIGALAGYLKQSTGKGDSNEKVSDSSVSAS